MNIINDYFIDRTKVLGIGKFSTVYQGLWKGKPVAVKVFNYNTPEIQNISVTENEVDIFTTLRNNPHKNIIECYHIEQTDDECLIFLELCDYTLESLIGKPIKESIVQDIAKQLVEGYQHLYHLNINHRDIKPANILIKIINEKLVPKITDFGLSLLGNNNKLHYNTSGSPLYMSPEMIISNKYSSASDLWSFGIVIYEMLYGYHPFKGIKNKNALIKHMKHVLIEFDEKIIISNECKYLLLMLLQKDHEKRLTWRDTFNNIWIRN